MTSEYTYFESKCAVTGLTRNLGIFRLIDMNTNLADATDIEVCDDARVQTPSAHWPLRLLEWNGRGAWKEEDFTTIWSSLQTTSIVRPLPLC